MYRLKPAALLLSYAVVGGGVHLASSHEVIQSGMRPVLLGAVSLCAIAMSWAALVRYIVDAREAKQEILRLSSSDGLTGLMNRHKAIGALDAAISTSVRTGKMGVLMIVGLDRFKNINSSYGHAHGDRVINATAKRLKDCVRDVDTVARLGGDEFLLLLEGVEENSGRLNVPGAFAESVRVSLQLPYQIDGCSHYSSASIGVTVFQGDKHSTTDLLKQAHAAMYQAKELGRNAVTFFDKSVQEATENRALMERELRRDIYAGKLMLLYQAQVSDLGQPIGAEALVRWNHDTLGLISPGKFIPIAEESHLIVELGTWVLETACKQLSAWANQCHTRHLTLSVNVSPRQFAQEDFLTIVSHQLACNDFPPECLKLELTEGVVITDVADVVKKMLELKRMGVRIAMDDFGTGYSSLASLKRLPIDQVKIDQSFVRDISSDDSGGLMIKTVIAIARDLKIDVIAEGVETEKQLAFLKRNGCKQFQGFYFGRPVPIGEFEDFVMPAQAKGSIQSREPAP